MLEPGVLAAVDPDELATGVITARGCTASAVPARRVVPEVSAGRVPAPTASPPSPRPASPSSLLENTPAPSPRLQPARSYRVPWAELLEKGLRDRRARLPGLQRQAPDVAFIADPGLARKILEHLELDATGPPVAVERRAQVPVEQAPDYDVADPIHEE